MRTIAVVVLAFLVSPAFAQEGIYVGLGFGSFDYEEDAAFLAPAPFEDTVASWRVYGGFEINEHFGIEVRYGASEEIEQRFSGTNADLGEFTSRFDTKFTTTSAVAMGALPMSWGALLGGVGYFDTTADASLRLTAECCGTLEDTITLGDDGLMAVLGAEWRFGRFGTGFGLRLEYEWLDVENASGSTVGVGAAYRF